MQMKISRKVSKSVVAAVVGLTICSAAALAEYPDRPILLTVAYDAGGATDFQARIVTMVAAKENKKGEALYLNGQPMVIQNRPGGKVRRVVKRSHLPSGVPGVAGRLRASRSRTGSDGRPRPAQPRGLHLVVPRRGTPRPLPHPRVAQGSGGVSLLPV